MYYEGLFKGSETLFFCLNSVLQKYWYI